MNICSGCGEKCKEIEIRESISYSYRDHEVTDYYTRYGSDCCGAETIREEEMIDEKNCGNCKYEKVNQFLKPCKDCFDSFCGKPFPKPSNWEEKVRENGLDCIDSHEEGFGDFT